MLSFTGLAKSRAFLPEVTLNRHDAAVEQKLNQLLQNSVQEENFFYTDELSLGDEYETKPEVDNVIELKYIVPDLDPFPQPKADNARVNQAPPSPSQDNSLTKLKPFHLYKTRPDPSKPGHYLCDICSRSLKNWRSWRRHYRRVHLKVTQTQTTEFKCSTCQIQFRSRADFLSHNEKTHQKLMPRFECDHCQKSFGSNSNKLTHEVLCPLNPANDRLPSTCKFCKDTFLGRKALNAHIDQAHADVCKFPCKICGARLTTRWRLNAHQQAIHERKFQSKCHLCNKGFYGKYRLKQHMEIVHLNIKRFVCEIGNCEKKYSTRFELRRHEKVDHFGKKFTCTEPNCGREHSTKQSLDIHMLKDHRVK